MAESKESNWLPLEPTIDAALKQCSNPIDELAQGRVPAILIRGAYPKEDGERLIQQFYDQDLVPGLPQPGERIEGKGSFERRDIGTSLGNLGSNPDDFFASAQRTLRQFDRLFDGLTNPVQTMYQAIEALSGGKSVITACEPDGRTYGPAIFRCHMPHWGYPPHIDSVRKREERTGYAVHRFQHQLAGVLMLQPAENRVFDSILYHCDWDKDKHERLEIGKAEREGIDPSGFQAYVEQAGIDKYHVTLNPGDLYLFNAELVHEAPLFTGHRPRMVMATFFGYSPDDHQIMVWS